MALRRRDYLIVGCEHGGNRLPSPLRRSPQGVMWMVTPSLPGLLPRLRRSTYRAPGCNARSPSKGLLALVESVST